MYNGLAERVEVRVEASAALEPQVSPKPEELWTSKNGVTEIQVRSRQENVIRTILKVGDTLPTAVIDGKGVCTVSGSSPRIYIDAPNQNLEISAEVLVEGKVEDCCLVARSNHQDRPDGFGGYYLYLSFKEKKMYFKKVITHVFGYSSRLQGKAITFNKGV
jgi:hypothetical protein